MSLSAAGVLELRKRISGQTAANHWVPVMMTGTVLFIHSASWPPNYILFSAAFTRQMRLPFALKMRSVIVGKVGRMLIFCTGAVTHNFQIAFERLQYRVKWHVLDHIRPPATLQNFQYSIETIFAF